VAGYTNIVEAYKCDTLRVYSSDLSNMQ